MTAYLPPPPVLWAIGGVCALILTVMLGRATLRGLRAAWKRVEKRPALEDALTLAVACIATGVSAQGMWRFTGDVLGFDGPLRALLFAFIELAVLASAVRARRNMRDNYSAGVDGMAVWALACLTAVLSSLDARSLAEAIFRLAAPLVAAWLWERGMSIERRRITGRSRIKWRFTPERAMVRLGLAEATDRTAAEVDAQRRLTRVALAADKVAELAEIKPGGRRHRRAIAKLKKRGRQMVTHTAVSSDAGQQQLLMDQLAVTRSITRLSDTAPAPFWEPAEVAPALTESLTPAPTADEQEVRYAIAPERVGTQHADGLQALAPALTDLPTPALTSSEQDGEQDGEQSNRRNRPDDQDDREAEEWIRARCRGRNGIGRCPKWSEVEKRFGFSNGWAGNRVQAVKARMSAQGYTFLEDGRVLKPGMDVPPALTANGVESDHADDVPMTAVEVS